MALLSTLRFEDDGGLPFTLIEPLIYTCRLWPAPLVIPAGFQTDLASIPQALWSVLPPMGKYDAAAVVHDYLYQLAPRQVTRAQADGVLRDAMAELGVSAWQRWAIYLGVRAGGWKVWNDYRAEVHV